MDARSTQTAEAEPGVPVNLRDLERESIRRFVERAADDGYLSGRVLDFGAGKMPYRDIIERLSDTEYYAIDSPELPGSVVDDAVNVWPGPKEIKGFNSVLITQVLQYVANPYKLIFDLRESKIVPGGYLVMTYPTNWPEVEPEDLHRFTKAGMERMLIEAGYRIERHERRASVNLGGSTTGAGMPIVGGDEFALGYGCIARA